MHMLESNMRLLLDRAVQMCRRDELAKVRITMLIFRKQHQPVDCRLAADLWRPRNGKHRTDDRLHTLFGASVAEGHRRVETVSVDKRHRGEAQLCRALG